jgi:hypothetical protein
MSKKQSKSSASTTKPIPYNNYLKIPPAREKMSTQALEGLRHFEQRLFVVSRDEGPDNHETKRIQSIIADIRSKLTPTEAAEYAAYMGQDHSAPVAEVPQEAEAERSI